MKPVVALETAISEDLLLILEKAKLPLDLISFKNQRAEENSATIVCQDEKILIHIKASGSEWGATFYLALQKLGFYFPHPRISYTPNKAELFKSCGKTFEWKPSFKFRGFHLHTLHPNEWVHGFLMGKTKLANETVRWLARNYQNVFDLNLVRMKKKKIYKNLRAPFKLAKSLGVYPGISLGAALHQQNSFKLLGLVRSLTGMGSQKKLRKQVRLLSKNIDFSFLTMEAGTSEFTPVKYERALGWMDGAAKVLTKEERQLFVKVHVSSNQKHPVYGNFNFLPSHSTKEVGIFPHTVMFYGLFDEKAPMYGNKNFKEIRDFTFKEMHKRPTWYYPETSYFIFMDIDVPLLLTDYLGTRSFDMKKLSEAGLEGHINFTTGQELGYWLMDWNVALMANSEFNFDPLTALKLLGEDQSLWERILLFQTKFFKEKGLISMLSSSNFQDEVSKKHRIHERNLIKELNNSRTLREEEILLLQEALDQVPPTDDIVNLELKNLMKVSFLRISHALELRLSMKGAKKSPLREGHLLEAKKIRLRAQSLMQHHTLNFNRYPEAFVFERHKNPTSYQLGYGFTARDLHLWKREEEQVRREKFGAFFMNPYNIFDIIL